LVLLTEPSPASKTSLLSLHGALPISDEIPPAFGSAVRTMQPGDVLGPVRGPSGFQLLQLVDVRDASAAGGGAQTQYHARHILIRDRKSTRLNSSHVKISYAVFCLKKK